MPGERAPQDLLDLIRRTAQGVADLKTALNRKTTVETFSPAYTTGWSSWGSGWRPLTLYKINGFVRAFGLVQHPTVVAPTGSAWDHRILCTVPVGWRPLYSETWILISSSSTLRWDIRPSGDMYVTAPADTTIPWASVTGMAWPVEQ
jgi:hypothetical protein